MKANELRIGNFVRYSEEQIDFKVVEISEKGISVVNVSEETWIELDQFDPIKLTEEWLLKFGFEKGVTAFAEFWHYKKIRISQNDKFVGEDTWLCMLIGNNIGTNIKYVHELQNIYFALTGEELEIK